MSKPFNDEPVEVLIPKLLSEDGKIAGSQAENI